MIIVNYWQPADFDPETDIYGLELVGVTGRPLDLLSDVEKIQDAIRDFPGFNPQNETLYQVQLDWEEDDTGWRYGEDWLQVKMIIEMGKTPKIIVP